MMNDEMVRILRERQRAYTVSAEDILTADRPDVNAVAWFRRLAEAMRLAADFIEAHQ
jgi:hypothetical protein